MREAKDRGSKWLLEHHGDSVLRLAGITGFTRWRPAPTELVYPLESPDSVLEVFFPGREEPDPIIVEIATYPERRVSEQMARDAMLVMLSRNVLPTLLTLVLHRKGNLHVTGSQEWACRQNRTRLNLHWQVIELWNLPADELLATNDVGLVPLIPLTRIDDLPEAVLRRCRQRIDQAPAEEQENLLVVARVMAAMRYNDEGIVSIFGVKQMFDDSPMVQEVVAKACQKNTLKNGRDYIRQALEKRFGKPSPLIVELLNTVTDEARLHSLFDEAISCASLDEFRALLN